MVAVLTPQNARAAFRSYGGLVTQPVSSPDRGLALGIYGPGGSGKTTLAATITESDLGWPALDINARGNPHVISSYADKIDVTTISKFSDVEAIRQGVLKDKECPYKSVILDNVSEMWSMDLRDLYGPMSDIDWRKHSASTADILQLVRNWMDLAETGPRLNVIFIFQETPEARTIRGQEVDSRSELGLNKALQYQVPTLINFLGRLYQMSDNPPYVRMLDFSPVETMHQAKLQVDPRDALTKDIPMEQYNPSLASILDTVRGHKPWPIAKHAKPTKQR